jgi:hypothetical protein
MRVNSGDLRMFTDSRDVLVVDMATMTRENLRHLFMYIEKLPLVIPDVSYAYGCHISCKIARAVYNDLLVQDAEDVPCPRMWLTLELGV